MEESDMEAIGYFQLSLYILQTSLPTILQEALPFLVYFCNSYFLRFMNNNSLLGAVGIADSFYQIIIFGFGYGFGFGLNLLVAEAYGAGDFRQSGLYLHRSLILNWTILVPSILIFLFSAYIFSAIGTLPELAGLAQEYLTYLIIPSILFFTNISLMNFLIAFRCYKYPSMLTLIGALSDLLIAYLCVYRGGYGLLGIAAAVGAFELIRFIGLVIYFKFFFELRKSLSSFSLNSFKDLWPQFKFQIVLVLVSLVMCMMMEVNQLYSGMLSKEEAAAQGLMFRFYVIFQTVPDTVSYITCSKVSYHLGKGNPYIARKYVKATTYLILAQGVIFGLLWLALKEVIVGVLCGSDHEISPFLGEILYNVAYVCVIQSVLLNYAKQLRRFKPDVTLKIIILGVIGIQIPTSYILGIHLNYRLTGLWMGVGLACFVMAGICAYYLHKVNFEQVSQDIRVKQDQDETREDL